MRQGRGGERHEGLGALRDDEHAVPDGDVDGAARADRPFARPGPARPAERLRSAVDRVGEHAVEQRCHVHEAVRHHGARVRDPVHAARGPPRPLGRLGSARVRADPVRYQPGGGEDDPVAGHGAGDVQGLVLLQAPQEARGTETTGGVVGP